MINHFLFNQPGPKFLYRRRHQNESWSRKPLWTYRVLVVDAGSEEVSDMGDGEVRAKSTHSVSVITPYFPQFAPEAPLSFRSCVSLVSA